ncbi:MAG: class I SAM-dependent methyltransferase [Rhodocyclaceae bacterium]
MSDETVYLVAKDYSAACVYAGEHETALRFWSHALTSSRNSPKAADAIPADNASEYDATPAHRKLAEEFIGFVRQNLANGDNFIDLCCGTGLNAEFLDRPDSRTIGIDLELGGLKAAGRIHYFHELLEGSIEDMLPTLPAAHFDAIWCCGALYFFHDLRPLFAQAARLLKPDGILAFNAWPGDPENDVRITRGGTPRYCHSKAYLESCASDNGFSLKDFKWRVAYHMPNWFMAFQKTGNSKG